MITSEKIKLLINDPKFREAKDWSLNSRQQALNKIYANQKQIHRSKVVQQCLMNNQSVKDVNTTVDFLQSKIQSVEEIIVHDIQRTLDEKQKIVQKYKELEDIYQKANKKYQKLVSNISPQTDYDKSLQYIEREVNQIKQLYEENIFLKNMNKQIKQRIREKQQKAKILTTP